MIYILLAYSLYPFLYVLSYSKGNKKERIIVIQTAKIGDLICSTPVFREIKKKYPTCHLAVAVDPSTTGLLNNNPHVDEIIPIDRRLRRGLIGKVKLARLLYRGRYDVSIILLPNITNIIVSLWAFIPLRVCVYPNFAGKTLKYALPLNTHLERHVTSRMSMETYLESLKLIGIKNYDLKKEVYPTPCAESRVNEILQDNVPYIGVALGTGNQLKDWGLENFVEFIQKIIKTLPVKIVLLGSDKDIDKAQNIKKMTNQQKRVIDLCGSFNLSELPSLVKKFSLLIGVDTGLIYMADALGIPVIDIAGPCNMSDQRPTSRESIILQKKLPCVPCSHTFSTPYSCRLGTRECINTITFPEVLKATKKLLSTASLSEQV